MTNPAPPSSFKKPAPNPNARPLREFPLVGDPEESLYAHSPPQNAPPRDFQPNYHPDPFDNAPPSQEEINALRRAREEKLKPTITPSAKQRIEYLADIGKIVKEVEVGGTVFSLRTLKAKELREVYLAAAKATNRIEELMIYRQHSLAFSICKLDHHDLELMVDVKSFADRLKMVDDLEDSTAAKLFEAYTAMKNEADAQFSLKTEQDVKEVSADLGK